MFAALPGAGMVVIRTAKVMTTLSARNAKLQQE